MASSKFHHLVPVNAVTAECGGTDTGSDGPASVAYDDGTLECSY